MSFDLAAARANMVESQVRTADVTDYAIQDAMRAVPRESLLPAGKAYLAYADAEVEYAPGRWMLRPRDVGKLLQAARPRPGERALAVASPYAALVLEAMGLAVTRLDEGDLAQPGGEYELIICEASLTAAPAAWAGTLAPAGRMALIERRGAVGQAKLFLETPSGLGNRDLFDCSPPFLPGFEPQAGFVF